MGYTLSTGSISNLCERFLTDLEALHLARVPQLRTALAQGYPLHIDATCEHGKGGLFVCMDGWRGWVLVAGRIPSEHEDHLRPLVQKTTGLFSDPIAIVRDLGKGGARDLLYPFGLVHLKFYQRCQQVLQRIECWVQGPRTLPERRAIEHIATLVRGLRSRRSLYHPLLRYHSNNVLRLIRAGTATDQNDRPARQPDSEQHLELVPERRGRRLPAQQSQVATGASGSLPADLIIKQLHV